jgi:hypothetical protein
VLTIISVKFGSSQWLEKNLQVSTKLNPNTKVRWLIVNNDNDPSFQPSNAEVLPATPKPDTKDKGSQHHAQAIQSALALVKTRFVLILDHDFYVIRPNWMQEVIQHMQTRDLSFFGSVWHPRWSYQYRYFPSVHHMMIDLEKIPLETLNFLPDMNSNTFDKIISHPRVPLPQWLRTALQIGQFRDTGWRIYQQYQNHPNECLTPHFIGNPNKFIPDRFSLIPKKTGYFTQQSFLKTISSFAYKSAWEEFYWQHQPYALHLRRVGRNPKVDEYLELYRILEKITS